MGDVGRDSGAQLRQGPADTLSADERKGQSAAHIASSQSYPAPGRQGDSSPFHAQFSSISSHQQHPDAQRVPQQLGSGAYSPSSGQQHAGTTFNMGGMAAALPDYALNASGSSTQKPSYAQQTHRVPPGVNPTSPYQLQQTIPYGVPAVAAYQGTGAYGGFGQSHYPIAYNARGGVQPQLYGAFNPAQQRSGNMQQPITQYQQVPSPYYYVPGGYGAQSPQSLHGASAYGSGFAAGPPAPGEQGSWRSPLDTNMSAVPRGPPRKPRQSGHALWVGNLPPGAIVLDLKDHFSRGATRDIESLFLISKSNCAFVNYRTESACAAAMQRFHDSRFQGVRLVCRLRRSSATVPGTPSGPASQADVRRLSHSSPTKSTPDEAMDSELVNEQGNNDEPSSESPDKQTTNAVTSSGSQRAAEKFFIIKSLTLQDLEQSVRNGIWATQSHNEDILNTAYESADNVYLVFSANKSGEYFGYARMISPIGVEVPEIHQTAQPSHGVETSNAPRTIPTSATDTAPKGRIIDDSARGTIFWEAELTDEEDAEEEAEPKAAVDPVDELLSDGVPAAPAYGKPFKVEWQSTNRLPFYRTRGLRNPWNANRDVKIARDGTELEPTVGRKLVQMFHRAPPSPVHPGGGAGQIPTFISGPGLGQPPFGL